MTAHRLSERTEPSLAVELSFPTDRTGTPLMKQGKERAAAAQRENEVA